MTKVNSNVFIKCVNYNRYKALLRKQRKPMVLAAPECRGEWRSSVRA